MTGARYCRKEAKTQRVVGMNTCSILQGATHYAQLTAVESDRDAGRSSRGHGATRKDDVGGRNANHCQRFRRCWRCCWWSHVVDHLQTSCYGPCTHCVSRTTETGRLPQFACRLPKQGYGYTAAALGEGGGRPICTARYYSTFERHLGGRVTSCASNHRNAPAGWLLNRLLQP